MTLRLPRAADGPEAIARLLTASLASSALIDVTQVTLLGRRVLRGWVTRRTAHGIELSTRHGRIEIAATTITAVCLVRGSS